MMGNICIFCGAILSTPDSSRISYVPNIGRHPLPTFRVDSVLCVCRLQKPQLLAAKQQIEIQWKKWLEIEGLTEEEVGLAKFGSIAQKVRSRYMQSLERIDNRLNELAPR